MARDYLAIQGSAVPSERAFSSGGLTATAHWNRLSGEIFEALQILKSGYRNGHIRASEQAEAHFSTYVKELADSEVDGDMPALE
jgi:hAT family C-terminal dimerisation region